MRFYTLDRLINLYTLQDLNQWLSKEIDGKYGQQYRDEVINLLTQAIRYKENHGIY